MRHINFIPAELRPKHEIPGNLIPAGLFLVLLFNVVGSVVSNIISTQSVKSALVKIEAENTDITNKIDSFAGAKKRLKLDEAIGSMKVVLDKKNYWSAIFREMSALIPEGVWLTGFSDLSNNTNTKTKEEVLLIKGEAVSQEIIAQFLIALEKSTHFSKVQIKYSEKESNISPTRYKFEFSIPIKATTNGGLI